ncbi:unnamed protein product [Amoebophrya sp. A120]|nr:unnamed protein product [Amoebophrya sp. A120]|eukprot:GSA120T00014378001.1
MHERFVCVVKCASQVRFLPDPDIFATHKQKVNAKLPSSQQMLTAQSTLPAARPHLRGAAKKTTPQVEDDVPAVQSASTPSAGTRADAAEVVEPPIRTSVFAPGKQLLQHDDAGAAQAIMRGDGEKISFVVPATSSTTLMKTTMQDTSSSTSPAQEATTHHPSLRGSKPKMGKKFAAPTGEADEEPELNFPSTPSGQSAGSAKILVVPSEQPTTPTSSDDHLSATKSQNVDENARKELAATGGAGPSHTRPSVAAYGEEGDAVLALQGVGQLDQGPETDGKPDDPMHEVVDNFSTRTTTHGGDETTAAASASSSDSATAHDFLDQEKFEQERDYENKSMHLQSKTGWGHDAKAGRERTPAEEGLLPRIQHFFGTVSATIAPAHHLWTFFHFLLAAAIVVFFTGVLWMCCVKNRKGGKKKENKVDESSTGSLPDGGGDSTSAQEAAPPSAAAVQDAGRRERAVPAQDEAVGETKDKC